MKKTLQDQYLLIKEGKGHKGVFLADAKRDFPHIVPNHATFDEAAASLKTKNIISENVIGLSAVAGYEPRKKESYETAFEAFLAEARKAKENEDEKVKAEEKKVSKPVEKDLEKNFDYSDDKNPDNLIFDQIMMGYYAEMKDPKNADKTMQQLKDIVLKNLAKDPIHYTKDGQFGVKDLGYVTEHPGLGTPKEPKGKYASSGYGNLSEGMENEDPLERSARIALNRIGYSYSVLPTYTRQDLIDTLRRESEDRFGNEELANLANQLESSLEESNKAGAYEETYDELKKQLTTGKENKFSPEDIKAKLKKKREEELERRKKAGESLEEITLRKAIQEMIDAELEEATQMTTIIRPKTSDKEREERDPSDKYLTFDKDFEKIQKEKGNLIVRSSEGGEDKIFITKVLHANLGPKAGNADLRKHLMDRANLEPAVLGGKEVWKIKGAKINSKGNISVFVPVEKIKEDTSESLMESVEKDLAAINKEAEHEVLQSKLDKIGDLINKRKSQLGKLDEDEDMKALTDKKKVKELQKDIKKLEQAKAKVEKMIGKTKSKKKEVIDETDEMLGDNMMGEDISYEENY
jgi:hypothetical protein